MRFYFLTGILFFVISLVTKAVGLAPFITFIIYSVIALSSVIYEFFKVKSLKAKVGKRLFDYDIRPRSKFHKIGGIVVIVGLLLIMLYLLRDMFLSNIAFSIWMVQVIVGQVYRASALKLGVMENGIIYPSGAIAWNEISSFSWKESNLGKRKGFTQLSIVSKPKIKSVEFPIIINNEVQPQLDKLLKEYIYEKVCFCKERTYSLRIQADYTDPLWCDNCGCNLNITNFPLSKELENELMAWAERYEEWINPETHELVSDAATLEKAHDEWGIALTAKVKQELGSKYSITFSASKFS